VAFVSGAILITPHVVAALTHHGAFDYGLDHFRPHSTLGERVRSLIELAVGAAVCSLPGIVIIAFGFWKGYLHIRVYRQPESSDTRNFLLVTNVAMQVLLVGLIAIPGVIYLFRFSPAYVMMAALAIGSWVGWRSDCEAWVSRQVIPFVGGLNLLVGVALTIVYTLFATHSGMQEPTRAGAEAILANWNSRYPCGPAYFLGVRQNVYGVGIEAGRNVTTISWGDLSGAIWFDPERLRRYGAVVIDTPVEARAWMSSYRRADQATEEYSVTLPLRRTYKAKSFTYSYHFLVPRDCAPPSPNP
jgi:hypothetical protein